MAPASAPPKPELLAPAGDFACLEAALEAGADAVYLGLTSLNARRRARNFSAPELGRACALAHGRGARVYLTLNIDLAQRELREAARVLELAAHHRVDAVLVRDPALLALRPHYPELEFHFSTQACIANSADVEAARELGLSRVVLARELTLDEIARASATGIDTEVFVQGALCFCVSGRCLLASWVGGRSGNRGQCTSPCRVPWTLDGEPIGTPLSMHDLSLVTRVDDLRRAGVRSLKIEGRLKTPTWVRAAVSLFRKALDGKATLEELRTEAAALGAYTGRALTDAYLDGRRSELTGEAGRERAAGALEPARASEPDGWSLHVAVDRRLSCRFEWGDAVEEWELSRAEVKRPDKATTLQALLERLRAPVDGFAPVALTTNDPATLLVPRTANAIEQQAHAAVRRALKARKQLESSLRPAVDGLLSTPTTPGSRKAQPRARVHLQDLAGFLDIAHPLGGIVVEGGTAADVARLARLRLKCPLIVALPQVAFEDGIPALRSLIAEAGSAGLRVEVNSWGGWWLARQAGLRLEAGPGLGVLNGLAARALGERGCEAVHVAIEADWEQLEDVLKNSPLPCSVLAFGRPALMTTRVELPPQYGSGVLEDRRAVRLRAQWESGSWALRPVAPMDVRGQLPAGAAYEVVDLVGSRDLRGDWTGASRSELRFNLERKLV